VYKNHARLAHQVQSVLAKLHLCRTKALGGHVYHCANCNFDLPVYNSCRDRHCPQCSGGRRAQWLDRSAALLLPRVKYFQIVFTLPSQLTSFSLGNRKTMFDLLLRAAWQALDQLLRQTLGVVPAASLVLHTWNQELDVHPHVHALVPGGFPSLDGQRWITAKHPRHARRRKAYLCDNSQLSALFREKFVSGMEKLFKQGELKFPCEAAAEPAAFKAWLKQASEIDWNVYIQGPPSQDSDPEQVAKYLARYMTGGPISDARIIEHQQGNVTFWARSRDKKNQSRPFTLTGTNFVQRWSQHILPKGFIKSRTYGGYHNTKRAQYMALCGRLLPKPPEKQNPAEVPSPQEDSLTQTPTKCPRCTNDMSHQGDATRIGWQTALQGPYRPDWYHAFLGGHGKAFHWYRNGY
jgi:hypothetical protein